MFWHLEPSITLGSLLLGGGYFWSIGTRRTRFRGSKPVERRWVACFLLGVLAVFLALGTPLDELSDRYLLTAHMVQHMLLTLAMPPLILAGTPGWLLRPLLRSPGFTRLARGATRPLVVYLAFNLTTAVSHLPPIYNFTLEHHSAHILLHLAYMGTALLAWWPILSPLPELPRLSYPLQMLYLFLQTIPTGLVGSFVALSDEVLYPTYAAAARITSLSPLADQQLAGLVMWLGGSLLFFLAMTVVFFVWASREEARTLEAV